MEIAVQEMRKSKSEHPNKFDPIVGAVLVDRAGHELGRSHRGGLRVGDHAEYQVIERMHANQNLQSSTLYVTLEPCTRRDPPKIPCAKRIVSARIGKVVIGMPDPNPDIHGHGIDYLLKNTVFSKVSG